MSAYQKYAKVFLLLLLFGCEEPFTPKGPYEQKLAVVGILSTTSDTQYVRVLKTYNPQGFNPYEVLQDQAVRGATVTVARGGSVVQYQETMVARTDTSRFRDNIVAYAAYPFRVQPGKTYSLNVATPSDGNVRSSITAPDSGYISVLNPAVLSEDQGALAVQVYIRPSVSAYMVRFYADFDVRNNSSWVPMRIEIPAWVIFIDTVRYFGYPKLQRRTSNPGLSGWGAETVYFSVPAYWEKRGDLYAQHGNNARLRRGLFVLTLVDQNLYTYFNIANAYQDQISIRTDQPDRTNIDGGLGVFGAMVEDSLYVDLQ